MAPLVYRDKSAGSYRGNNVNHDSRTYYGQKTPRTSLGKSRRAVPEVWFRIVHVAADHVKSSVELREQTIEVALGPDGAFENGNIGVLTRRVCADRVVCAVPAPRHPSRPPQPPKAPQEPRTPPVVETLRKALEWRRQLDVREVANQADIARREGVSRARVTQVLMLLRLAPDIQKSILGLTEHPAAPRLAEHRLRPIALLQSPERQAAAFEHLVRGY